MRMLQAISAALTGLTYTYIYLHRALQESYVHAVADREREGGGEWVVQSRAGCTAVKTTRLELSACHLPYLNELFTGLTYTYI